MTITRWWLRAKVRGAWWWLRGRTQRCPACGTWVGVTEPGTDGVRATYGSCGHHLPLGRRQLALALLSAERRLEAQHGKVWPEEVPLWELELLLRTHHL
jgi:hypothetical protein